MRRERTLHDVEPLRDDRYPAALLVAFAAVFAAFGVAPWFRQDWLLENLLVLAAIGILVLTRRQLRFSDLSYTLLFVFLVLHEVGAHYTYAEVPYDRWIARLTGTTLETQLGLRRNHYDRVIHFAYGLLILQPARELLRRVAALPAGAWGWIVVVAFTFAQSALYEVIEWLAAILFGGELGAAYLGTQGDEFDSQKDMALGGAGAVLAALALAVAGRPHTAQTQDDGAVRVRVSRTG